MSCKHWHIALFALLACGLAACDNARPRSHGPIVIGDSSLIVTESDPEQLKDLVTDLKPTIPRSGPETGTEPEETKTDSAQNVKPQNPTVAVAEKKTDTPAVAVKTPPAGPGLKAEFSQLTVTIPGLDVRISGSSNLSHASGATYLWLDGAINGNTLYITGTVLKVSQRYQSIIVYHNDGVDLPMESLIHTIDWQEISGAGNAYPIKDLDPGKLEHDDASQSLIRVAVQRAAQRRHMSRNSVKELVSSARHLRSVNNKHMTVALKAVMWKIDGKDEDGRFYSKQIRVDIPM